MAKQHVKTPLHCGHCSYQHGGMNMASMLPNMPMMQPMASGPWSLWHMPGMNMPSMPFMSPMPNMLHDSMDLMRQNMNLFQQKASMMGMFPTRKENVDNELSQSATNVSEHRRPKRSVSVKNGFNKRHNLQEEYKQRRKSLPLEHDLVPDFHNDPEGYCDFQGAQQRTSEPETLSAADVMSKSADEGYASYQKTYKDSQRDSVSNAKSISKLENYTKSPPMRRKSLPTSSEIVSEHENMFSSEVFAHPIHTNHSVPAFQTQKHQYRENVYKGRVNKSNDLDESLYSIDTSDDDDDIFDSSLEGKLFIVNCSLAMYRGNDIFVILTMLCYYVVYFLS